MKKLFSISLMMSVLAIANINAQIKNLTYDDFNDRVIPQMTKPVVIDFYADWCGPCRMYKPTFESVARLKHYSADFYRVDIDEETDLCELFNIKAVPTTVMIVSKDLDYIYQEGLIDKYTLRRLIEDGKRKYRHSR